ncbi:uncharacterized protein LOC134712794 isoform X2 [Mytilus trossulus]|uniref:uncharacterized protein LOC134712794 isoform X2 n=1 Tax=Mytilus trossulus TaxID=6551 RepID=UPI0030052EDD
MIDPSKSGSETLSIELEPYFKDIRLTNSKLKIVVSTSLKTTSNPREENNGDGSILIGVVATCIILIIFFAFAIIVIRRRRYRKETIDNNIQIRQSEEPQQSQQTGGEPIESRLLSSASNVDSQFRRERQNNQSNDLGIYGATGQRNELLASRSGQTPLSIVTHAPPLNDESRRPVTSRTNHPRFDDNIERNIEHRHGRQYNGRNPIDPSAPPLHEQSTEPSSTHSGSSRNINAIPPPSYVDVMSRSSDFDLR